MWNISAMKYILSGMLVFTFVSQVVTASNFYFCQFFDEKGQSYFGSGLTKKIASKKAIDACYFSHKDSSGPYRCETNLLPCKKKNEQYVHCSLQQGADPGIGAPELPIGIYKLYSCIETGTGPDEDSPKKNCYGILFTASGNSEQEAEADFIKKCHALATQPSHCEVYFRECTAP